MSEGLAQAQISPLSEISSDSSFLLVYREVSVVLTVEYSVLSTPKFCSDPLQRNIDRAVELTRRIPSFSLPPPSIPVQTSSLFSPTHSEAISDYSGFCPKPIGSSQLEREPIYDKSMWDREMFIADYNHPLNPPERRVNELVEQTYREIDAMVEASKKPMYLGPNSESSFEGSLFLSSEAKTFQGFSPLTFEEERRTPILGDDFEIKLNSFSMGPPLKVVNSSFFEEDFKPRKLISSNPFPDFIKDERTPFNFFSYLEELEFGITKCSDKEKQDVFSLQQTAKKPFSLNLETQLESNQKRGLSFEELITKQETPKSNRNFLYNIIEEHMNKKIKIHSDSTKDEKPESNRNALYSTLEEHMNKEVKTFQLVPPIANPEENKVFISSFIQEIVNKIEPQGYQKEYPLGANQNDLSLLSPSSVNISEGRVSPPQEIIEHFNKSNFFGCSPSFGVNSKDLLVGSPNIDRGTLDLLGSIRPTPIINISTQKQVEVKKGMWFLEEQVDEYVGRLTEFSKARAIQNLLCEDNQFGCNLRKTPKLELDKEAIQKVIKDVIGEVDEKIVKILSKPFSTPAKDYLPFQRAESQLVNFELTPESLLDKEERKKFDFIKMSYFNEFSDMITGVKEEKNPLGFDLDAIRKKEIEKVVKKETLEEKLNNRPIKKRDDVEDRMKNNPTMKYEDISLFDFYVGDYILSLFSYDKIPKEKLKKFKKLFEDKLKPLIDEQNSLFPEELKIDTVVLFDSSKGKKQNHSLFQELGEDKTAAINFQDRVMFLDLKDPSFSDLFDYPNLYIRHEFGDYLASLLRESISDYINDLEQKSITSDNDSFSRFLDDEATLDLVLKIIYDDLLGDYYALLDPKARKEWLISERNQSNPLRKIIDYESGKVIERIDITESIVFNYSFYSSLLSRFTDDPEINKVYKRICKQANKLKKDDYKEKFENSFKLFDNLLTEWMKHVKKLPKT